MFSKTSLNILRSLIEKTGGATFHHHYHILYDIVCSFPEAQIVTYLEIGAYGGMSAALVLQRPGTLATSIDLGTPISPEVAKELVKSVKAPQTGYTYLQGSSRDLHSQIPNSSIDVLFIDGDHSFYGVTTDFKLYSPKVKSGGFLIFDDYEDAISSPEVKLGVDSLDFSGWEIFPRMENSFNAYPASLKTNNLFILRKK